MPCLLAATAATAATATAILVLDPRLVNEHGHARKDHVQCKYNPGVWLARQRENREQCVQQRVDDTQLVPPHLPVEIPALRFSSAAIAA